MAIERTVTEKRIAKIKDIADKYMEAQKKNLVKLFMMAQ